ncbi:PilN domain-containing protein [Paraglaciecola sp. L3A3]|uniref:PilN domain-containing protein n=1 Tax=Paraglaciecola sp. L3A3 TaxID=2686358 RepID=UPI00131E2AD7|nr:PilN domain-containing protein [Paraglaciecola sp. L3A3]
MKLNINLYTADLQPKLRVLSLPFVVAVWLILVVVAVLINSYVSFSQQELMTELEQTQNNNSQQSALIKSLQDEYDGLVTDPKLLAEVATKQQIIKMKKRVYVELVGQDTQKRTGFADLMIDLAENHQKELWLTRIYMDSTSVTIEGATQDSEYIPMWVNKLSDSSFFRGQEFSDTRIFRDDEGLLNFILTKDADTQTAQAVANE